MKLRNLLAAAAIMIFAGCGTPYNATDTTVVVAPSRIQTVFVAQYPTATDFVWTHYDATVPAPVDWDFADWTPMDPVDFTVRFNMDNEDYYAWYDDNGNWIGTAYVVKNYTTLPAAISNTIADKFPDYTISSVNKQFQKDRLAYEVVLKNGESKVKLRLDGNGTITKQVNKTMD